MACLDRRDATWLSGGVSVEARAGSGATAHASGCAGRRASPQRIRAARSVLFVCQGNINRSAVAERVLVRAASHVIERRIR